jgi:hypothetical protein
MSLTRARLLGLIESLIKAVGLKNQFIPLHRRALTLLLSSDTFCRLHELDPPDLSFLVGTDVFRCLT